MVVKLLAIEDLNRAACSILNNYGFRGDVFRKYAPLVEAFKLSNAVITASDSRARQYSFKIAGTTGSRWHATGGEHFNLDGFFISREWGRRQDEENIEKEKS